jgi:uncharacterized protein (DUF433 family)
MNLPDFLTEDVLGFVHLTGHRIGLTHLLFYYNEGYSAEMLACQYPTLSLALIHKTIAFYLENRAQVDAYVARCQEEMDRFRASAPRGPSMEELQNRLDARRRIEAIQRAEA